MFFDSIQITEGGNISNLTVASGSSLPSAAPNSGELFFHTGDNLLYVYDGSHWEPLSTSTSGGAVSSVAGRIGDVQITTSDVSGLATVSWTGDYNDLLNKPTVSSLTLNGDISGTGTGTVTTTLATVNSSPVSDSFRKISVNAKGLVTASSAVTSSDITTVLGYTPASSTNATFIGTVTLPSDPVLSLQAATKQYVDNVAYGLNAHYAVVTATSAVLAANYSNGASGVGATLTAQSNGALGTVGGYSSVAFGNRILVKDQSNTVQNGIYLVTSLGSSSSPWVLTRTADFDNSPSGEVIAGAFTFVQNGTLAGSQWVVVTPGDITLGTTGIDFSQLSGSGSGAVTAGTGISVTGMQVSNTGVLSVNGKTGNVSLVPSDISGLAVVASTGSYSSLIGTPSLATVATSGSYNDLTNKPTGLIAAAETLTGTTIASNVTASSLTSVGATLDVGTSMTVGGLSISATTIKAPSGVSNGQNLYLRAGDKTGGIGLIDSGHVVIATGGGSQIGAIYLQTSGTTRLAIDVNGGWFVNGSAGTAGQVLTSNGDASPTWQTVTGGGGGSITIGTTSISSGGSTTTLAGLSSVTSTTFIGALTGNATTASTAATVTTAAQPSITSLGTLTALAVTGAITQNGGLAVGYLGVPQNVQGNYTLVLTDAGKHIFTSAGSAAWVIPSNAAVAFPIGTAVTFVNQSANACTISVTSDTMYVIGSGITGNRTLSAWGMATVIKTSATTWMISGNILS